MDETDQPDKHSSPHHDLEFTCNCELETGETEDVTVLTDDGERVTREQPKKCRNTITYVEHYVGMTSRTEARKQGYTGNALKFQCDVCGGISLRCPICAGSGTPGWYRGESTGEMLACHNCNAEEYARQQREQRNRRSRRGKRRRRY